MAARPPGGGPGRSGWTTPSSSPAFPASPGRAPAARPGTPPGPPTRTAARRRPAHRCSGRRPFGPRRPYRPDRPPLVAPPLPARRWRRCPRLRLRAGAASLPRRGVRPAGRAAPVRPGRPVEAPGSVGARAPAGPVGAGGERAGRDGPGAAGSRPGRCPASSFPRLPRTWPAVPRCCGSRPPSRPGTDRHRSPCVRECEWACVGLRRSAESCADRDAMSERSVTESLRSATATRASPDPVAAKGGTGASRSGDRPAGAVPPRPGGGPVRTSPTLPRSPGPGTPRDLPAESTGAPSSLNSPPDKSC